MLVAGYIRTRNFRSELKSRSEMRRQGGALVVQQSAQERLARQSKELHAVASGKWCPSMAMQSTRDATQDAQPLPGGSAAVHGTSRQAAGRWQQAGKQAAAGFCGVAPGGGGNAGGGNGARPLSRTKRLKNSVSCRGVADAAHDAKLVQRPPTLAWSSQVHVRSSTRMSDKEREQILKSINGQQPWREINEEGEVVDELGEVVPPIVLLPHAFPRSPPLLHIPNTPPPSPLPFPRRPYPSLFPAALVLPFSDPS